MALTCENKQGTLPLTGRLLMFALLASLVFTAAASIAVVAVASTFRQSRARIFDALQGRPLERIKPSLCASA